MNEITAINVFIEVDGKQHIALIDPEKKDLFMAMLGTFQSGESPVSTLTNLPPEVAVHLINLRKSLLDYVSAKKG